MSKPNFVFIYVDDLRYMLDNSDPHANETLPNLRQALTRGINFENVQCPKPICTPSRVSLLTGRRVRQTTSRDYSDKFRDKLETFPGILKQQGYKTYAFGKILDSESFNKNYNNIDLCPNNQRGGLCSFDDSFGSPRSCCIAAMGVNQTINGLSFEGKPTMSACKYRDRSDQVVEYTDKVLPKPYVKCRNRPNKNKAAIRRKLLLYKGGGKLDHPDYGIARAALDKIKELSEAETPFFVAIGFNKPHLSLSAPHEFFEDIANLDLTNNVYWRKTFNSLLPGVLRPATSESSAYQQVFGIEDESAKGYRTVGLERRFFTHVRQAYYATVNYIDFLIGLVLDELSTLNAQTKKNTHVIITSDHGFLLGEYRRIAKWTIVEATTRVPLVFLPSKNLLKADTLLKIDTSISAPVDQVDIFPTILDLAGAESLYRINTGVIDDKLPGSSLVPYFRKPHTYFNRAVSVSEYDSWQGQGQAISLRSKYFRYIRVTEGRQRFLFDYRGGPFYRMVERENVIRDVKYITVREWFENLWKHPQNDFKSWDFLLDIEPLDLTWPDVRGLNLPASSSAKSYTSTHSYGSHYKRLNRSLESVSRAYDLSSSSTSTVFPSLSPILQISLLAFVLVAFLRYLARI